MYTRIMAVMAATLVLLGCGSIEVKSQRDKDFDFSNLEHFAWSGAAPDIQAGAQFTSADADDSIRRMITEALQDKGYQLVRPEEADFLLSYRLVVEQRLDERVLNNNLEMGPGWGYDSVNEAQYQKKTSATYVMEYTEGTLVVDALQAGSKHLLWRGSAQSEIHLESSPETRRQRAAQAVKKMMNQFPARQ